MKGIVPILFVFVCLSACQTESKAESEQVYPQNSCLRYWDEGTKNVVCAEIRRLLNNYVTVSLRDDAQAEVIVFQIEGLLEGKGDYSTWQYAATQIANHLLRAKKVQQSKVIVEKLINKEQSDNTLWHRFYKFQLYSLARELGVDIDFYQSSDQAVGIAKNLLTITSSRSLKSHLMLSTQNYARIFLSSQQYSQAIAMMDSCRDAAFAIKYDIAVSTCYSPYLDEQDTPSEVKLEIATKLYGATCSRGIKSLCMALRHKFAKFNLIGSE
ncbi:hypothetical protein [Kordiimonas pumila]|uniref:Lipoprotein n=1 Tax=Kordiimonas pumila TaxID=2161677 RepID=A0ABV7D6J7_9PROT|nr:hypothetical protein [Kordiimonas pumila]